MMNEHCSSGQLGGLCANGYRKCLRVLVSACATILPPGPSFPFQVCDFDLSRVVGPAPAQQQQHQQQPGAGAAPQQQQPPGVRGGVGGGAGGGGGGMFARRGVGNGITVPNSGNLNSPGWQSPEYLAGEEYGKGTDVFSFGVCIWEVRPVGLRGCSRCVGSCWRGRLCAKGTARRMALPHWVRYMNANTLAPANAAACSRCASFHTHTHRTTS